MFRIRAKIHKKLSILVISVVLLISYAASVNFILTAEAASSYTGAGKRMQFYFHHLDNPVAVAGLETKYVMDTLKQFSFSTQQDALANAFYKPVGLPKIGVGFYLYPNLAGPVTIDGLWQVSIWVNGSAYKPAAFTLQFAEITLGGNTLWDSGLISPTVLSSVGSYVDVPVNNYNLSTPLTHTFSPGTTLFVGVEINVGAVTETRVWYDSELYPSKVVLPAKDYARPAEVKTYSYDNTETNLFYYNWNESQRVVIVRANVTDPFGGYDIHRVNMTIFDPAGNAVMNDVNMSCKSDGQWETAFPHLFEANYTYASTVQWGNYTVIVSVVDNNGYYHDLEAGTFDPFIEEFTHVFSIGMMEFPSPISVIGEPWLLLVLLILLVIAIVVCWLFLRSRRSRTKK
jgi:hypothetical protein